MEPPSGLRLTFPPVTGNANFTPTCPCRYLTTSRPGRVATGTIPFLNRATAMPLPVVTVVVPPLRWTGAAWRAPADADAMPAAGPRSRPADATITARRRNTRMVSPFLTAPSLGAVVSVRDTDAGQGADAAAAGFRLRTRPPGAP